MLKHTGQSIDYENLQNHSNHLDADFRKCPIVESPKKNLSLGYSCNSHGVKRK